MAPFRNRDRSNRSGRGTTEHNVLEGLPISQYREMEVTIGNGSNDNKSVDKDAWPELPMPRDSHLLPLHSQQLLRAARSGRTIKPPPPVEDDDAMKDEEEETKEMPIGFTVKKFVKVPRHVEMPEPEYLAKRRKGLPSQYVNGSTAPALRETVVKKLDAEGNVAIYKVLVPQGQAVEGEIQPTDKIIEVAPATAAPGTIVEGIGVVNAEGIVVASDVKHHTPPRRRAPPPKRKRGGPGRGRRRVTFAGRREDQGVPNMGGDLSTSRLRREEGSVVPSDGDTPMADVGGEEDEGSGEEGSEDEDQDMGRNSTPVTPRLPSAPPTSAPALNDSAMPDITPTQSLPTAESEAPELPPTSDSPAPSQAVAEIIETSGAPNSSTSSEMPLSRSRQNSPIKTSTPLPTTDAAAPEITVSEATVSIAQSEPIPAPVAAPESVVVEGTAIKSDDKVHELEATERAVAEREAAEREAAERKAAEHEAAERKASEREAAEREAAEREAAEREAVEREAAEREAAEREAVEREAVEREAAEREAAERKAAERQAAEREVAEREVTEREVTEREVTEREVTERSGSAPSAPPSEPDLLGSLERQLEQDSKDMAG